MVREEKYLMGLVKEFTALPNETGWIEFKTNYYDPEGIGEYISCLSNAATLNDKAFGYMIWGINDETHEIVGTNLDIKSKKVGNEDLENWLQRLLNPKIIFSFYELIIENKKLIILEITRAINTVTKFKNEAYIRIGSYKKKLNEFPEIEKQLWKELNQTQFEDGIALENITSDIVLQLIDYTSYFDLLQSPLPDNKQGIFHYLEQDEIIVKSETGNWNITNFGAILLAKNMEKFPTIKRKILRIIQYKGTGRYETIREEDIAKGYAVGYEDIIKTISLLTPKREVIGAVYREEIIAYPEIAIRELVANCIIHQKLDITGTGPMVEIFDDRIEITNPGIPLVETDRFLDNPPKSRNEKMASFFRRIDICEERGTGFDKIVKATEEYQLPAPKVDQYPEHTKVTLYAQISYSKMDKQEKLRACYLHACLMYVNGKYLTNSSLRERFGLDEKNKASISRLIKSTLDSKLIKTYEEDTAPRYLKYIPYWG